MVASTMAAVAVVPLTIDLYTPEGSFGPSAGASEVSTSTAAEIPSALTGNGVPGSDNGVPGGAGASVVDPEAVVPATPAAEPDVASGVVEPLSDPAAAEPIPGTGAPTLSAAVPHSVPAGPISAVPPTVPVGPIDGIGAPQIGEFSEGTGTDAAAVGGPAPIDDGVRSGMGGDLPPEVLPAPDYPQCPITEAGPWSNDTADPYTCIPPYPIQFHEPTPPGISPELLEPVFEAPVAPVGSVGGYEPTPPGIDPSLLEPIMEDAGLPGSGE